MPPVVLSQLCISLLAGDVFRGVEGLAEPVDLAGRYGDLGEFFRVKDRVALASLAVED